MIRLKCDHLLSGVVNSVQSILRRSSTQPVPCVEVPPRVQARLYELGASGQVIVAVATYVRDGDFFSFRRAQLERSGPLDMQVLPKSIRRVVAALGGLEIALSLATAETSGGRLGVLFDVSLFNFNVEMAMKERIDNEPV